MEETLHIPETPLPPLAVPPNFLLWLGLWGVGVQKGGCLLSLPSVVSIGERGSAKARERKCRLCGLKL